jgi:phosphatidylserine/phosphatidylglycerophosphate/cardiolipin synthase-like enzyme
MEAAAMTGTCDFVTWFSDRELRLVPDTCVVVGGTPLLRYFLRRVADRTLLGASGHLALAKPFVGTNLHEHLAALPDIAHGRVDLLVVTGRPPDARRCLEEFGELPWRSLQINVRSKVHAKIFSFSESTGGGVCLVGSHNLTRAGVAFNEEAGVLFTGRSSSSTAALIHECHDTVTRMARKSVRFRDSLALDDQSA